MKKYLILPVMLVLVLGLSIGLYGNGLNLNGNGSKAVAMGGAFVGLADDYSAVYWNPAGLTQLKGTSLSLFLTDVMPNARYRFDLLGIDAETGIKHNFSGGLGFFKSVSDKVTVGIYAYVPAGSGADWDPASIANLSGGTPLKWKSLIGIISVSPAIAVKVSDKLSLGATLNINYGLVKMKRPVDLSPLGHFQYEEDLNGMAVGASLGILYKPTEKFSLGLSYKTPFKIKISGTSDLPAAAYLGLPASDDAEREATWPMWLGAGICYKPSDKLTLTADLQFTNWKVMTVIPMSFYTAGWKAYFEDASSFELKWKNTVQIRMGVEYKISDAVAFRAGYYHDPNPSPHSTQTIILPEITYNFINFGFGYTTGALTMDFCLEYGIGKDKSISLQEADPRAGMPGIHGADILVPNLALTIRL